MLSIEDALWNCVSCELWSAYKMNMKGLILKAIPALKMEDEFVRNPLVITDRYVEDGDIVYGESKSGEALKEGKTLLKSGTTDFRLLDAEVDAMIWRFTNLFPGCVIKSLDGIRAKKKFFWDQSKLPNRHWLAANMSGEALLGFHAFNTRKLTGQDTIDFVKYRQLIAEGRQMDDEAFAAVLGTPQE
jgi:6-oxo-cyclohex-1-ene-carbonyl-CoA hydrolase